MRRVAPLTEAQSQRRRQVVLETGDLKRAAAILGMQHSGLSIWVKRKMPDYVPPAKERPHTSDDRLRTYHSWRLAQRRCRDPKSDSYRWYGGKGITFAACWDDLDDFIADVGIRPVGTTLDRIDSSKNYEPGNVRWVDMKTQQRNKANNTSVAFRGERLTVAEIAERCHMSQSALCAGIFVRGLDVEEAVALPVKTRAPRKRAA